MFHLTFTLWVLPRGQSDFHGPGRIFSLVVIYMMNVLLLALFLVLGAPEVSFASFGNELMQNAGAFLNTAGSLMERALRVWGFR